MAKYKISKKLQVWMDDYTETFHGIEPIMGMDELLDGTMKVADYKRYNLDWITDHTAEQVRRLED